MIEMSKERSTRNTQFIIFTFFLDVIQRFVRSLQIIHKIYEQDHFKARKTEITNCELLADST